MKTFPKLRIFIFYWLPFLLWATVVFSFSASPTTSTSEVHWQDFIIKKTAHIIEYAVFTTLLYRALKKYGYDNKKAGYLSLVVALLYGISDEYHQSFTPGREPRVRDVLIDFMGSGIAIYAILKYFPNAHNKIKELALKLELI